jgi:hypothetical protein
MTDLLVDVAIGVLFIAVLSFMYGFISAWIKDRNQ